jgi:hypothetical protein
MTVNKRGASGRESGNLYANWILPYPLRQYAKPCIPHLVGSHVLTNCTHLLFLADAALRVGTL